MGTSQKDQHIPESSCMCSCLFSTAYRGVHTVLSAAQAEHLSGPVQPFNRQHDSLSGEDTDIHRQRTKYNETSPKSHSTLLLGCKIWALWVSQLHVFGKFELLPELVALLRSWCRCRKEIHLVCPGHQGQQQHMGHACKFPFLVSSIGKCPWSNIPICKFYISLPKVKSQLWLKEQKIQNKPASRVFSIQARRKVSLW